MRQTVITLMLAGAAIVMAGCAQEVIAVHDSSMVAQFSQLQGPGWQVTRNDQPKNVQAAKANDPNVRVIREADFTKMRFNTNFRVDDPKLQAQLDEQNQNQQGPSNQAGMNPFGTMPVAPGH
jgi:hypothetical protein